MKTKYFILGLGLCFALTPVFLFAQTSAGLNYQAVLRTSAYVALGNKSGTAVVSILNGSTELYREIHTINTDQLGLFNLIIGKGNALSGNFATLDWGSSGRSVKVVVSVEGKTYDFAPTELQAVPYAKVAERSLQPGPAGPKGDKGDAGAVGAQGPTGSAGAAGAPGAKGDKGDKGDIGATGPAGTYTPGAGISILGNVISNTGIKGYSNSPQVGFGLGIRLIGVDSVQFTLTENSKIYVQADVSIWGNGSPCVGAIGLKFDGKQEDRTLVISDNPVGISGNNKITASTSWMQTLATGVHKVTLIGGGASNNCGLFIHPHLNVLVMGKE